MTTLSERATSEPEASAIWPDELSEKRWDYSIEPHSSTSIRLYILVEWAALAANSIVVVHFATSQNQNAKADTSVTLGQI